MVTKGQKINQRYEIIKLIGEGGMANVYLANDIILNRKVAVKVLRGDLADDEKFIRRFKREALAASNLSHPNIVEIYDVGDENGDYYIVMEYAPGKSLKQLIKKRKKITMTEVIDIMLQATAGFSHAHDSYIIHRDIKPQNIMIMEDGSVKIMDFGIAMALNSNQLTQTNSIMGSVHYLPPEQATGKGSTIKSDIYSLGIMMFELVTGRIPFKGENAVEIALKQMKEPLPNIKEIDQNIPQSIENIILKAAAKNPKNRYNNVNEMYNDLKNALNEEKINEKRIVYKYPENDLEKTKIMKPIKEEKIEKKIISKKIENKTNNKGNKLIIILSLIFFILLSSLFLIFIIIPTSTKTPSIKIPDVKNLSVIEAEEKLERIGFEVNIETKGINSDTILIGNVVKTSPAIGRTIKKGSKITLFESIGAFNTVIKNYIGTDYTEVKYELENKFELNVLVEKKEITDPSKYENNIIIDQTPKEGARLSKGDIITLYIPNMNLKYPDMVSEKWTEEEAETFAKKHNLILKKEYIYDNEKEENIIISQSREKGTNIIEGYSFKIVISKKEEPTD